MVHVLARASESIFSLDHSSPLREGKTCFRGEVLLLPRVLSSEVIKWGIYASADRKIPINNTNTGCSWFRAIQQSTMLITGVWRESCYRFKQFLENGGKICMGMAILQQIIWTFSDGHDEKQDKYIPLQPRTHILENIWNFFIFMTWAYLFHK